MKPFLKTNPVLFILFMAQVWTHGQSPETLRLRNTEFEAYNKYFVIPPGWTPQRLFLGKKQVKELRLIRFFVIWSEQSPTMAKFWPWQEFAPAIDEVFHCFPVDIRTLLLRQLPFHPQQFNNHSNHVDH